MHHNQGENRNQLFMYSYEQVVAPDAFVRVIDAFVDMLDLKSFGFSHVDTHEECTGHIMLNTIWSRSSNYY